MLSRLRLQVTFPLPLWWLTLEMALQKVAKALLFAAKQGLRPIVLPAYFVRLRRVGHYGEVERRSVVCQSA